jgi:hypothetical protein
MKFSRKQVAASALALPLCAAAVAADQGHQPTLLAEAEFPSTYTRNSTPAENFLVVGLSGEYSDNAARVEQNPASDTLLSAQTAFGYALTNSNRAAASLEGDLSYQEYTDDTQESELIAHVNANGAVDLIQDHLSWVVADELTQGRVDETQALTATNRQNVNLAMTGLHFATPLGDHNLLRIDAQYELSNFEVSNDGDSEALVGRIAYIREIGRRQALRLGVTARDVTYKGDTLFPDYKGVDYSLAWAAGGAYTDITLEGGYTTIDLEGNKLEEPLYRVQISRSITQRATLDFVATHELTGTSDAIHFDQSLGGRGPRTSEVSVNPDPFVFEFAGLGFEYEGRQFALEIGGSTSRDRYTTSIEDDRNRTEGSVRVDLLRGPRWTFGVFAQYEKETFIRRGNADSQYKDVGLFTSVALGARTGLQISFGRSERDTTFLNGSYEENFGRLAVMHALSGGSSDSLMNSGSRR